MFDVLALQAIENPEQEQNQDLPGHCSILSLMCSTIERPTTTA